MEGSKKNKSFGPFGFAIPVAICLLVCSLNTLAQNTPVKQGLYIPDFRQVVPQAKDATAVSSAIQILVLITVISLAPALLVMVTCFTRIIVVLSLLRQALATQQLPPNQVLIGLALFMTFMVMAPTWYKIQTHALSPYLNNTINQADAFDRGIKPLREFMIRQIQATDNEQDVQMFLVQSGNTKAKKWADVPTTVLIPSFITSELKTAFIIGFRIYLPFLIIDMVIASVLISMGMMMLPPMLVSLPFKLLLFVLVDGWRLIVGSLITSFV
ncbi:MAG: flagellar type III secretion system pore protein FliP [Phycisphaerae bacterium]